MTAAAEWDEEHGVWYEPGTSDAWILKEGGYGPALSEVTPEDRVLDAGAHIGSFSVLAARTGASVYAVEAVERNFNLLGHNLAPYGDRAVVHHAAIVGFQSIQDGMTTFYTSDRADRTAMHRATPKRGYTATQVPAVTLPWLNERGHFTVMKVDIEGAEYQVFPEPGALTGVRLLVFELHRDTEANRQMAPDLIKFLQVKGFEFKVPNVAGEDNWGRVITARRNV